MIPLSQMDWESPNNGARTNFCTTQQWWTNENISLQGGSLGPTDAEVGEAVTIVVGIQGLPDPGGVENTAAVQHVQAWACYPNTGVGAVAGTTNSALVVSSMQPPPASPTQLNNPSFPVAAGPTAVAVNGSTSATDYWSTTPITASNGFSAPPYAAFQLAPQWTPTSGDLMPPNATTHCCLIATSQGLVDATQNAGEWGSAYQPAGAWVQQYSDLSTDIQVCTTPQQGQRNIAIVPVGGGRMRPIGRFGFLAVSPSERERTPVVVNVRPVAQERGIDPVVRRALEAGPHRDLPLQPGTGVKRLHLLRNEERCEGYLARLIREAEEIVEELIEEIEHPFRHTSGLRLTLPPNGVQPLLLEVELEKSPPGTVHTFDITQTNPDKRSGGIKVALIVIE